MVLKEHPVSTEPKEETEVNGIQEYLKVISETPLLTRKQEISLARKVEEGLFVERLMFPNGRKKGQEDISLIGSKIEACLMGSIYDAVKTTLAELELSSLDEAAEKGRYREIIGLVGKKTGNGKDDRHGTHHLNVWNISIAEHIIKSRNNLLWKEHIQKIEKESKKAKEDLITANLLLVPSMLGILKKGGAETDDVIQDGNVELIKAVEGYDYRYGKFSTYAINVIKDRVLKIIPKNSKSVTLGRFDYEQVVRPLYRARDALYMELKREPTPKEIAEKLNRKDIEEREVSIIMMTLPRAKSLQALDSVDHEIVNKLPCETESPVETTERSILREKVRKALKSGILEKIETDTLALKFGIKDVGIGNGKSHTLREAGEKISRSYQGVSNTLERALENLRGRLSPEEFDY